MIQPSELNLIPVHLTTGPFKTIIGCSVKINNIHVYFVAVQYDVSWTSQETSRPKKGECMVSFYPLLKLCRLLGRFFAYGKAVP